MEIDQVQYNLDAREMLKELLQNNVSQEGNIKSKFRDRLGFRPCIIITNLARCITTKGVQPYKYISLTGDGSQQQYAALKKVVDNSTLITIDDYIVYLNPELSTLTVDPM